MKKVTVCRNASFTTDPNISSMIVKSAGNGMDVRLHVEYPNRKPTVIVYNMGAWEVRQGNR